LACEPTARRRSSDFHLAQSESAAEWERFLGDLPTAFPGLPIQRCWAHKIRNVLAKVRRADQAAVKAGLHAVMQASWASS